MTLTNSAMVTFILVGLAAAFPGEASNNFLVMHTIGNFIFAMLFYTISLAVAFFLSNKMMRSITVRSFFRYAIVAGLGWGLVVTEWILVGNHPLNPDTKSILSQLSMAAYHTLVYTLPVAFVYLPHTQKWLIKALPITVVWIATILTVGWYLTLHTSPEIVLAWSIITTYFLGYLPFALYCLRRIVTDIRMYETV